MDKQNYDNIIHYIKMLDTFIECNKTINKADDGSPNYINHNCNSIGNELDNYYWKTVKNSYDSDTNNIMYYLSRIRYKSEK